MKPKRTPKTPEAAIETASLGSRIREARMQRNWTVEQLHEKTRVPVESILALEEERFEDLPALVYTRGFIKLICRELQLPYEELAAQVPAASPAPAPAALPVFQLPASASSDASREEEKTSRVSTGLVVFILLVLASLAISYIASQKERSAQNASASEPPHIDITG